LTLRRLCGRICAVIFVRKRNVRLVIALLALTLIVLGLANGQAKDVLNKAINICTECLGLG
jgi:hypothetical protein